MYNYLIGEHSLIVIFRQQHLQLVNCWKTFKLFLVVKIYSCLIVEKQCNNYSQLTLTAVWCLLRDDSKSGPVSTKTSRLYARLSPWSKTLRNWLPIQLSGGTTPSPQTPYTLLQRCLVSAACLYPLPSLSTRARSKDDELMLWNSCFLKSHCFRLVCFGSVIDSISK